jgi:hypothetical protein
MFHTFTVILIMAINFLTVQLGKTNSVLQMSNGTVRRVWVRCSSFCMEPCGLITISRARVTRTALVSAAPVLREVLS